jgi:hypothetical protein
MVIFSVSRRVVCVCVGPDLLTLFVNLARCGLSFLAIQEPGISKYCSLCQTEYLDEDSLVLMRGGKLSRTFSELFEAFDTCLYCGGKFQPGL